LGGAVIGAHLRRLSERIDSDANRVYAQLGVAFEQRWMGVLDLFVRRGPMSVNEIARELKISHPSVSQTRSSLMASRLVAERTDPADGRRRILYLTEEGKRLVDRLKPAWAALEQAGQALNAEAGDVMTLLENLEAALERQSILDRVNEILIASSPSER
jgi:DNA-binding MarR family transcriptional regulator